MLVTPYCKIHFKKFCSFGLRIIVGIYLFRLWGPYSQHVILFVTYEWTKYVRVLVPGRLFKLSLMFVGKASSQPQTGSLERCFIRVGSDVTRKHCTRLEKPARNKNSSLLGPLMSYKENKVLSIRPLMNLKLNPQQPFSG